MRKNVKDQYNPYVIFLIESKEHDLHQTSAFILHEFICNIIK